MAKKIQSICFTETITLSKEYIDEHLADIVHFKCDTSSDVDNDYLNVNILMVENGELVEKHDKFYDPKYLNHDLFNWSEDLQDECLVSLWRFRLDYVKEKMVNKRMQELLAGERSVENVLQDFVKKHFEKGAKHKVDLVDELSREVGEDLRKVFTKLETVKYEDRFEPDDAVGILGERAKNVFAKPNLVEFSDEDDDKICATRFTRRIGRRWGTCGRL